LLVYKGFSVPVFGHFPGDGFPAIARETPVLLAFLQFMGLLEPPILSRFFTCFLRALNPLRFQVFPSHLGGIISVPGDFKYMSPRCPSSEQN